MKHPALEVTPEEFIKIRSLGLDKFQNFIVGRFFYILHLTRDKYWIKFPEFNGDVTELQAINYYKKSENNIKEFLKLMTINR